MSKLPKHHPAIDALLAADLTEEDLIILGSAQLAVVGKTQVKGAVPEFGIARWAGQEFRNSLREFAIGVESNER